jgi:hypothetical protein
MVKYVITDTVGDNWGEFSVYADATEALQAFNPWTVSAYGPFDIEEVEQF